MLHGVKATGLQAFYGNRSTAARHALLCAPCLPPTATSSSLPSSRELATPRSKSHPAARCAHLCRKAELERLASGKGQVKRRLEGLVRPQPLTMLKQNRRTSSRNDNKRVRCAAAGLSCAVRCGGARSA